jgi:putative N-acetylmannosamine-6-phosphate epimerase
MEMPVLADVDPVEAGIAAAAAGATAVATTLSGYTEAKAASPGDEPGPDLDLLRALVASVDVPVLAEGRYGTPADVRAALDAGAHAVVVGTAISDPFTLTRRFARATEHHADDR